MRSIFSNLASQLESEAAGIAHGTVQLRIEIREGQPFRAILSREESLMIETESKSACSGGKGPQGKAVTRREPGE